MYQVWLDNKLIASVKETTAGNIIANIPPSKDNRKLSVLVEAGKEKQAGAGRYS
jgi:hypothetical protein